MSAALEPRPPRSLAPSPARSLAQRPVRRLPLLLGLLVLAACWLGPLSALAKGSFAAHMTMHMGVVAVGTGLVSLGLAGSRLDPARRWPRWFAPIPASVVEAVVVWAWHAPALHHAARHRPEALVAEQGSFLLAGLFLWLSAFGGEPHRGAATTGRTAAGVVGLLLTSMHMTLLGALLALTQRPLYAHPGGGAGGEGALGLTALADQHLGGAIMLLVGGASYLAGGLWLTAGVLRSRSAAGGARGVRGPAVDSPAVGSGAVEGGALGGGAVEAGAVDAAAGGARVAGGPGERA